MANVTARLPGSAETFGDQPTIQVFYKNRMVKIEFYETLFSADTPHGPWCAITNADSSYVMRIAEAQQFYGAGREGTNVDQERFYGRGGCKIMLVRISMNTGNTYEKE